MRRNHVFVSRNIVSNIAKKTLSNPFCTEAGRIGFPANPRGVPAAWINESKRRFLQKGPLSPRLDATFPGAASIRVPGTDTSAPRPSRQRGCARGTNVAPRRPSWHKGHSNRTVWRGKAEARSPLYEHTSNTRASCTSTWGQHQTVAWVGFHGPEEGRGRPPAGGLAAGVPQPGVPRKESARRSRLLGDFAAVPGAALGRALGQPGRLAFAQAAPLVQRAGGD